MKTYLRSCGLPQSFVRSMPSILVALTALQLSAIGAHATAVGVSTDPMGNAWTRGAANTGYGVWDTFPGTSFSGATPGSTGGLTSPTLGQSQAFTNFGQGAGLYDGGDVLFAGGNSVNFSINGAAGFTIRGLTLQIKRAGNTGTLADANGFTPMLSINGGTPIAANAIDVASGHNGSGTFGADWGTTTWYWGAALAGDPNTGNDTFALSFSKIGNNAAGGGLQRTLDGMAIDVGGVVPQVVPEPSTWAMLIFGAVALLMSGRAARTRLS